MKQVKNLLLYTLLFSALSCDKDLNEKVFSDITEQTYSYTDVYQAIGIVYANMRSFWGHTNYYGLQETSSDEVVMPANASGWDDGGIYKRIHLHTWNSENPQMNGMWNSFYSGVINSNRIIELLEADKVPFPAGISKESIVAEVKVARAFFYWLILDNFGDAALITNTSKELPSKATRKAIYDFVVAEINEALPSLSENNNKLMYGRFNKWAAKTLLANVYLNANIYAGEPKWGDAITQCNDIIQSGKYTLETNYRDIFKTSNESSTEIVFAIPLDENIGTGFSVHMWSWHGALKGKVNMQATPWGSGSGMGISQFIDTYNSNDQRLADSWLSGPQFGLDGVTPLLGSYDQAGKQVNFTKDLPDGLYTDEFEGYRMNKYEVKVSAKGSLDNDFPFFRYTEVLMIKAECLLRTGDKDAAAELVSLVRQRAFKTHPELATVTGDQLAENTVYKYGYVENYIITDPGDNSPVQYGRMLDELGWEFAWEAHRRRDNIRFGVFTKKSWLSHKPNGDDRITFSIPQQAINSNPNLK